MSQSIMCFRLFVCSVLLLGASLVSGETLILPAFALNVEGADKMLWSSEIYLTNPSAQPVQVSLVKLLPGHVDRPAPCDLFMPPTRVVPPRSAVVWTASGLAVDLGCAEQALGALILNADGPIHISSRMVSHARGSAVPLNGVLVGQGQEVRVVSMDELPPPGDYLLPALAWRCADCESPAFDTFAGFVNPGSFLVTVQLEVPEGAGAGEVVIDGEVIPLPASIDIEAESWVQVRLRMKGREGAACTGPENFDLRVSTTGSLAMYASVVDRSSHDARTVDPVAFH